MTMVLDKTIQNALKKTMQDESFNQTGIAFEIGVVPSEISKWKNWKGKKRVEIEEESYEKLFRVIGKNLTNIEYFPRTKLIEELKIAREESRRTSHFYSANDICPALTRTIKNELKDHLMVLTPPYKSVHLGTKIFAFNKYLLEVENKIRLNIDQGVKTEYTRIHQLQKNKKQASGHKLDEVLGSDELYKHCKAMADLAQRFPNNLTFNLKIMMETGIIKCLSVVIFDKCKMMVILINPESPNLNLGIQSPEKATAREWHLMLNDVDGAIPIELEDCLNNCIV